MTTPKPSTILIPAIIQARKARGWTQSDLARASGLKQSAVAQAEAGSREPRASTIETMMRALGLDVTPR